MATLFITGGTGFIGTELIRLSVAAGYEVQVLTRTGNAEAKAKALGATPIPGDLQWPGDWQQAASRANFVMHLAQPQTFGGRITKERAEKYRAFRAEMDRRLLDPLRPEVVQKIVYVGGTSYYGNVGKTLVKEDATPNPKGWGPYIRGAIEALSSDVSRGLPIVQAFPGYVYGNGSWFLEYIVGALKKDRPLFSVGGVRRVIPPIHVKDCARALLFLLEKGAVGVRYFVVDHEPCSIEDIYGKAASLYGKSPRFRNIPRFLFRLLLGELMTDGFEVDCALSNERLRSLGFVFDFPTYREGVEDVMKTIAGS